MAERAGIAILLAALATLLAAPTANARVQEYQIVRLVTLRTGCRIDHLEDRSPATGPMHFLATCNNPTFYPDGVTVLCADSDDDRSCRITTEPLRFLFLDLLHR